MYNARQSRIQSKSRVKGFIKWGTSSLLILAPLMALVYVQFFQEAPTVEPVIYEIEPYQPIETGFAWPQDGTAAVGAIGYGLLERSSNDAEAVPIASIAKLFTALAVMQQKPFEAGQDGELITFGPQDEQFYVETVAEGGSSYPINNGSQLTQYEALQALLVASANNVADSLAAWAFGSEQEYLEYVNTMVTDMGLTNTVITDASGMSPGSVSTVDDLMVVSEAVLEDPVLSTIVRQSQTVIEPTVGPIFNTNPLLGEQYVIGLKTGTTDEAGANLIFAADFPLTEELSERIIGITLGLPDRAANTSASTAILATAYENFGFIEVVPEGQVVGAYEAPWSDVPVEVVSNGGMTIAGWTGSPYRPEVAIETAEPGLGLNQEVGSVSVDVGGREVTVPVTAAGSIPEPSLWWRIRNIF